MPGSARPSSARRRAFTLPAGAANRSAAHMALLRSQRAVRQSERAAASSSMQLREVAEGWNSMVLRVGDHIATADSQTQLRDSGPCINRFSTLGTLRMVWRELGGKSRTGVGPGKVDVQSSHRGSEATLTIAALSSSAHSDAVQNVMTEVASSGCL
eukprot:11380026-Alexandrium_andersonii.AAC.1